MARHSYTKRRHARGPSKRKAREILRHGSVRGHRLTQKQRRFMGARASGQARR